MSTKALEYTAHISLKTMHVSHQRANYFLNSMLIWRSVLLSITFVQQKELAPEATNLAAMVKLTTLMSDLLHESLSQGRGRPCSRHKRAKPTPCAVLKNLPLPRGREKAVIYHLCLELRAVYRYLRGKYAKQGKSYFHRVNDLVVSKNLDSKKKIVNCDNRF